MEQSMLEDSMGGWEIGRLETLDELLEPRIIHPR